MSWLHFSSVQTLSREERKGWQESGPWQYAESAGCNAKDGRVERSEKEADGRVEE